MVSWPPWRSWRSRRAIGGSEQDFYLRYLVAVLLLAALVRYWPVASELPEPPANRWWLLAAQVLDNVIVALVAAVAVTLLLKRRAKRRAEAEVVYGASIHDELDALTDDVSAYWYRGHLGRYPRLVIFEKMAARARSHGDATVQLQLIDPNSPAASWFAEYKNRKEAPTRGDEGTWDQLRVRREILATIVAAYAFKAESPLQVEISLLDGFSMFRFDHSDEGTLMTKDDTELALKFSKDTFLHTSTRGDLRLTADRANIQNKSLSKLVTGPKFAEMTTESVFRLLRELSLADDLQKRDMDIIIDLARACVKPKKDRRLPYRHHASDAVPAAA